MFKIESYVTPILLSYVDKYVKDFKPADAQVSLWGGGVVLHNLVLKADVLQQEVSLPFTLISGRIHELLIQVPWTKIMSEPIVVTIDTIECVLNLRKPTSEAQTPQPSRKAQVVEAPPGYMQALVRRIVSNIVLRVHHLIVKYVEDDIVLSLNVKYLVINCADGNWNPAFADIDQAAPVLRRLVQLEDFTLCLDRADADGKIRFYQEPLLYRCQLNLRVMTRLISANTRRASALHLDVRSSKLAWGVSSEQLALLLRLLRERTHAANSRAPPAPAAAPAAPQPAAANTEASTAEPAAAADSWSEWAWSWLPTLRDQDDEVPEAMLPAAPIPVHFQAYFDSVIVVYKIMELEGSKKRARSVLELSAEFAAVSGLLRSPTLTQLSLGIRTVSILSHGRCVCGHLDLHTSAGEPTYYLTKSAPADDAEWQWPEVEMEQETATKVAASYRQPFVGQAQVSAPQIGGSSGSLATTGKTEESATETDPKPKEVPSISENDFWTKLEPVVFLDMTHERSPPIWSSFNPYENPPTDFEYSDWNESVTLKITVRPIECLLCMGLMHRFAAISAVFRDLPPPPVSEVPLRPLTVEECESLQDNLPQRRAEVACERVVVRLVPWDHSLAERPAPPPLALDLHLPDVAVTAVSPLYPRRVCEAVCQFPNETGRLTDGARLTVIATVGGAQFKLAPFGDDSPGSARPVARTDVKFIYKHLLHHELFARRPRTITTSLNMQIGEFHMCGSLARLQAAWQVIDSLINKKRSSLLKYSSLPIDATSDQENVAVDITVEDISLKKFVSAIVTTHLVTLQALRVTALHAGAQHKDQPKQAWLFSGPDNPVPTPYFRMAVQMNAPGERELIEFVAISSEPAAAALDPLLLAFLAYRPEPRALPEQLLVVTPKSMTSSAFLRIRNTPPSSSGRGGSRSSSGAELVHTVRARSKDSSSEPERRPRQPAPPKPMAWNEDESLLWLHRRLSRLSVSVDLGLVLVYVPLRSASAVDCVTVRDAMERHASCPRQSVLCISLGRLTVRCVSMLRNLWKDIRPDGPTYEKHILSPNDDSFPWKISVSDMSCYTISARGVDSDLGELKSRVKMGPVVPQSVLELVTTTVTLSVVTKKVAAHAHAPPHAFDHNRDHSHRKEPAAPDKTKFFQSGLDFKPTTLKEFIRGPASRKAQTEKVKEPEHLADKVGQTSSAKHADGPVISIGVNIHADTPPLIVRLDHEQVKTVAAAVHCSMHLLNLMRRRPLPPRRTTGATPELFRTMRSVSESEEPHGSSETSHASESSELIPIFDSTNVTSVLKKILWFQWVVSRATVVVTSEDVRLALDVDDIISTLDLQDQYNQFKVKVTSASIKHYEKHDADWVAGVLKGRVLEAREPVSAREDNNFLGITITQARIIDLPSSWKEELHPKLLESKKGFENDTIWELYATLAPLEAVLQPLILENIILLLQELAPQTLCNIQAETAESHKGVTKWPYLYLVGGGLRLLVCSDETDGPQDDTFVVQIGKVEVNPHPENPICRRRLSASPDTWESAGAGHEGRQYELFANDIAVLSAKFHQIVCQESSETNQGTATDNPALKWTQPLVPPPKLTPILHNMDINCVLAPTLYVGSSLACGPGLELNLITDVVLELSLQQLALAERLAHQLRSAGAAGTRSNLVDTFDADSPDEADVCPYAVLIDDFKQDLAPAARDADTSETDSELETKTSSHAADSGVEASLPRRTDDKKATTVAFVDTGARSSEYMEIFVTMGTIDLSLYVADDGSPEVVALRPPGDVNPRVTTAVVAEETPKESPKVTGRPMLFNEDPVPLSAAPSSSDKSNERVRTPHIDKANTELRSVVPYARRLEGMLPLIHVTLQQPNMYYWKKKTQKNVQMSLFNMWVGLGEAEQTGLWQLSLLSTARGSPDPVTDIPPALATCRLLLPCPSGGVPKTSLGGRGTMSLEVERPLLLEISEDRLVRLKGVIALVRSRLSTNEDRKSKLEIVEAPNHILYDLRRFFVNHALESVTVRTGQMGVSGSLGALGWENLSFQVASGARPERLVARTLCDALLVSLSPHSDPRHLLLHPTVLGCEMQATWEGWRRAEGLPGAQEPLVQLRLDLDRIVLDVKPEDLHTIQRLRRVLHNLRRLDHKPEQSRKRSSFGVRSCPSGTRSAPLTSPPGTPPEPPDTADHYYKDDLRSGAFKMVNSALPPMVYQVGMYEGTVTWKYPHPRAITRVVAFPLPDQNEEVGCVLEHFMPILGRWEPHAFINLSTAEPREYRLHSPPPDAQFASIWRIRICSKDEEKSPFEFHTVRFLPRVDPLVSEPMPDDIRRCHKCDVTAEQLAGSLQVDSYFSPRLMPRLRTVVNIAKFELHLHNSLPYVSSQVKGLEGYYVSRPLMKAHRVLGCAARDATLHAQLSRAAGLRALLHAALSCQVLECATGTIEPFVEETRCQAALSVPGCERERARVRVRAAPVRALLHVPRLRTCAALAADWHAALRLCELAKDTSLSTDNEVSPPTQQLEEVTATELEGRVSLWICNHCTVALRVGQEGTDQLLPVGPGSRLAYRWRNPTGPMRLRFARVSPSTEWSWSKSIPFSTGSARLRLENCDDQRCAEGAGAGAGLFLHTRVMSAGARRTLRLSGRVALANMLRYNLLFKVRGRCAPNGWRTVNAGELAPESFGQSVLISSESDVVLKIKFVNHDTGWSGDIPLKECPKENVPWLVKVPSEGDLPYLAVWCRVVRGRNDGCIMATIWPLFVLYSHLPLDIDVHISTEPSPSPTGSSTSCRLPTLVQTALGRGHSTHLMAPGTTSARHSLTFQYRNIESPVTREAVALHYGVTSESVFEQRAPIQNITDVIDEIETWLERSGSRAQSAWPYSTVTSHWSGKWRPALLQPRCDVTARYRPINAGGGCCLEVQLCPLLLLANASTAVLTLRAHDAAPLCKLEPGYALSPPSALLQKPFFLSMEVGRETYVSAELGVWHGEVGQYGAPPPRRAAPAHPATIAITCGYKLSFFNLYYDIKDEIHCLGVSNTYVIINQLGTALMVSAVAVAGECEGKHVKDVVVRFKSFVIVEPTKEGSIHGAAMSQFALQGQWDGEDVSSLRMFLGLALSQGTRESPAAGPSAVQPLVATAETAPLLLKDAPARRALSLRDAAGNSVAVVATLQRHEQRWLVTVAPDPCPQLVLLNLTRRALAVAQPRDCAPTAPPYTCVSDCPGARWHCVVAPNSSAHYSTPAHCARYPPSAAASAPAPPPAPAYLTLAAPAESKESKITSSSSHVNELEWCAPVAVAAGEQLVQLAAGATIKMRVVPHPHSTLLELRDVDQNDISASDIRRRLAGEATADKLRFSLYGGSKLLTVEPSAETTAQNGEEEEEAEQQLEEDPDNDDEMSLESTTEGRPAEEVPVSEELSVAELARIHGQVTVLKTPSSMHYASSDALRTDPHHEDDEDPPLLAPTDGSERKHRQSAVTLVSGVNDASSPDPSQYIGVMRGGDVESEERVCAIFDGLVLELSAASDTLPLLAIHLDRAAVLVVADNQGLKTTVTAAEVQVDNRQYDSGQFDFAVVAATCRAARAPTAWGPLGGMLADDAVFDARAPHAHLLLTATHDRWTVLGRTFSELTELEVRLSPLALYVEDAYVSALVRLFRDVSPPRDLSAQQQLLADGLALRRPLRLRALLVQPLRLTLTLHTAVRMYIALDQSPLTLSAFKMQDMMTSSERLTHALTVHYLSAAILGAGWVVGGLELLGAPGALAARVGGASGGVRGVASAAAAALLRSLSAWAGSLARNLDLLAGDEEHARRAAAARRRPPATFFDGLATGIANFAINMLGAVGGLAHHPLVGVAVGETDSGAAALRRGLLGALTKPLSATADLVAYAGHGLLHQTGWDPVPQPRELVAREAACPGWQRDCVRWAFRLSELSALDGFEALVDSAPLQLLLTHRYMVVACPETDRVLEMIDFKLCTLGPYQGPVVELTVAPNPKSKSKSASTDEEVETQQLNAAAMARVARYTGAASSGAGGGRVLALLPAPGLSHALHAALAALLHHNHPLHLTLL